MSSRTADTLARVFALAALLTCGLAAGCKATPAETTAPPSSRPTFWYDDDPEELLAPARGVVAIDRSGELSFRYSTLHAIDGDASTTWASPPEDPEQWVVYELPARTKLTRVGASIASLANLASGVAKVRFEGSLDGREFHEIHTVDIPTERKEKTFDVPPSEVRFLRVTTLGNHGDAIVTNVPTLYAKGVELEPPARPQFAGRWAINDQTVEISQEGNAIFGAVRMTPPMILYGAVQGQVARFSWSRGNENGIGWLSVNASSTRLSGIWWWVDPLSNAQFGETWYGEKRGDVNPFTTPISQIAEVHLRKTGKFPLYGFVFRADGELDVAASRSAITFVEQALAAFPNYRVRLEAVGCSTWDETRNLVESRDRAAKLGKALGAAGLPMNRLIIEPRAIPGYSSAMFRLLYTKVDFSLAGN